MRAMLTTAPATRRVTSSKSANFSGSLIYTVKFGAMILSKLPSSFSLR